MYKVIGGVRVWGDPDESSVRQMVTCSSLGNVKQTALMADHHKGYSQPIGGVIAYRNTVSPSGVGYDIACGNKAVRTDLFIQDIRADVSRIVDEIAHRVEFGIGRKNPVPFDHELFDDPAWKDVKELGALKQLARDQLGTVGAGNHYVDILTDEMDGSVWVAVHFGSRGFGHRTATGFLNLAAGRKFDEKAPGENMDQPPTLLAIDSYLGQAYLKAMTLAGRYAYAGRDIVVRQVLDILKATSTFVVHNHHNYAWYEKHDGEDVWVVRKGATPCFPGQLGFIGGSMGDISVVVKGKDSPEARDSLYSTVHGAGRLMSRTQAAGKMDWRTKRRKGGLINENAMRRQVREYGVELRGAGADEAPEVYRKLKTVLDAHKDTLEILHVLKPVGVVMASPDEFDPYKD